MRESEGRGSRPIRFRAIGAVVAALAIGCGGGGSDLSIPSFGPVTPLDAADVGRIVQQAAAAVATNSSAIAVTDRQGSILAVYAHPGANRDDQNIAVSLARTTSFFSNSQAPLTSRTVQFLSSFHFPPAFGPSLQPSVCPSSGGGCGSTVIAPQQTTVGVAGTDQGPLWQINATNRGAPIETGDTQYNPGKAYPRSTNIDGSFPSPGITLLPGAVPLYKNGRLVGGVGVYDRSQPFEVSEFAAFAGAEGYRFPVDIPPEGAVVLVGIRLPYVATFERPKGVAPGAFGGGSYVVPPRGGNVDPFGYLIGPRGSPRGNFTAEQVDRIVQQAVATANETRAAVRLPGGTTAAVIIVVTDLDGLILAHYRMEDTLTDAVDVVPAKARSVVYYSRPEGPAPQDAIPGIPPGTATTTTALGFLSQPVFPPGIDGTAPGPLYALALQNQLPSQATRLGNAPSVPGRQNGLTFFPGAVPLYDASGSLIGGLGVSGDGVENNDVIAAGGAAGFEPPDEIRIDNYEYGGLRIPYLKFSRQPER